MRTSTPSSSGIVRLGVAGGGFVAQVVHLPHLHDVADRFHVAALAEPDPQVRAAVEARWNVPATFAGHAEMLAACELDAVLVCSPNATHAEVVLDALDAGCHVLVEKPLCLGVGDADRVIEAAERARRVVQVAYMKRFDPAYEELVHDLARDGDEAAYVTSRTVDPGLTEHFGPHVTPSPPTRRCERQRATANAIVSASERLHAFMGALVHDVNAVHGILDALGIDHDGATVADGFGRSDGSLAGGTVVLPGGLRWTMAWSSLPEAGTFDERIELLGSRGVRRLEFPAPYLRQSPTAYRWIRRDPRGSVTRTFRSWQESYARQLEHFHACVTTGEPCRTSAEQARADIALLAELHSAAAAVHA